MKCFYTTPFNLEVFMRLLTDARSPLLYSPSPFIVGPLRIHFHSSIHSMFPLILFFPHDILMGDRHISSFFSPLQTTLSFLGETREGNNWVSKWEKEREPLTRNSSSLNHNRWDRYRRLIPSPWHENLHDFFLLSAKRRIHFTLFTSMLSLVKDRSMKPSYFW